MDWYTLVKFIHVVAAIFWLGGGFAMLIVGLTVNRTDGPALLRYMQMLNRLALPLFVPASSTVLFSGLTMAWFWVGFADAWLVLALAGIAISIGFGVGFIKPVGEKIAARAEKEGASPALAAEIERFSRVGHFDYTIMLAIVALMVFKPGWQDTAVLYTLALLLAFSAALFLIPRRRTEVAAA